VQKRPVKFVKIGQNLDFVNKHKKKPKGQSRLDNPEIFANIGYTRRRQTNTKKTPQKIKTLHNTIIPNMRQATCLKDEVLKFQ
jgi:hypothetical protein